MPCYRPLDAWQLDSGDIVFRESADTKRVLKLPCGKCIGCNIERSRVWAVRSMHEAQMHTENCVITLTYDDEHLPPFQSLDHEVWRKFAERVRYRLHPFRYLMCGEYGSEHNRPHYHACLFGLRFPDTEYLKESQSGSPLYTSKLLSTLWPYGFSSMGNVTFESAQYIAKYVTKRSDTDDDIRYLRSTADGEAYYVKKEYGQMSRRPGIGYTWWQKFGQEVLNRGNVVMNGTEMKPPRYYAKLCKDPAYDWVEQRGMEMFKPEDNTPDRLAVRENVTKAAINLKKRNLK